MRSDASITMNVYNHSSFERTEKEVQLHKVFTKIVSTRLLTVLTTRVIVILSIEQLNIIQGISGNLSIEIRRQLFPGILSIRDTRRF